MGPLEHVCVEVKSMDFFSLTISKSKDIITMEFCYLNLHFSCLVQEWYFLNDFAIPCLVQQAEEKGH